LYLVQSEFFSFFIVIQPPFLIMSTKTVGGGRFSLQRKLGAGNFGAAWLARDANAESKAKELCVSFSLFVLSVIALSQRLCLFHMR
jgi:hypothetical protein